MRVKRDDGMNFVRGGRTMVRAFGICAVAVMLGGTGRVARAQAAPGPMHPADQEEAPPPIDHSTDYGDVTRTPTPPPPPPLKSDLAGSWKFNVDESDDPREKLKEARQGSGGRDSNGGNRGGNGGGNGGNNPGGIRIGGVGQPYPNGGSSGGNNGGGNPRSGGANGSPSAELSTNNTQIQEFTNPTATMNVTMKDVNEIDFKDGDGRVRTFFTDDRKVDKPKDPKPDDPKQFDAYWEDTKLVAKDDLQKSVRVTRSLEPAPGGMQLIENVTIETNHSNGYVELKYVYDRVGERPPVPAGAAGPAPIKSVAAAPKGGVNPGGSDSSGDDSGDRPTLKRPPQQ
jgi:hypothetical protein